MTPATIAPAPDYLDQAGQALRQVLLRLDRYAKGRVQRLDLNAPYAASTMNHVRDLDALMVAVQEYEQAITAYLPPAPAPAPFDPTTLTPPELLAVREADPIYRLGYVRGHQEGVAKGQRGTEPAMRLYAEHAQLPAPPPAATDYDALVTRVRRLLADMTERYGAGPLPRYQLPARHHGTI